MLYGWLPYRPEAAWDGTMTERMRSVFDPEIEAPLRHSLANLFAFPVLATLLPLPQFEAGRVGMGPIFFQLCPFVLMGGWSMRKTAGFRSLLIAGGVVGLVYSLWFMLGPSQRVRHLLPLYAPALAIGGIVAFNCGLRSVVAGAVILTLGLQLAGDGFASIKYMKYFYKGETRDEFLAENVSDWAIVTWANHNLSKTDKLFNGQRQLGYLFDIPNFLNDSRFQGQIRDFNAAKDPDGFFRQMLAQGITVMVTHSSAPGVQVLSDRGCLDRIGSVEGRIMASRTLPDLSVRRQEYMFFRLRPDLCR